MKLCTVRCGGPHAIPPHRFSTTHNRSSSVVSGPTGFCCCGACLGEASMRIVLPQSMFIARAGSQSATPDYWGRSQTRKIRTFTRLLSFLQTQLGIASLCVTSTGTLKAAKAWTERPRHRSIKPKTATKTNQEGRNKPQEARRNNQLSTCIMLHTTLRWFLSCLRHLGGHLTAK